MPVKNLRGVVDRSRKNGEKRSEMVVNLIPRYEKNGI
jgi:hypothetical protein